MDAAAPSSKRIAVASGSGCPLPDEIVEDILSRLPAKPLQRLQCVSRSFHAMIASRAFHDAHFRRHSNNGRRPSLFIRPPGLHEPFYAYRPGTGSAMETEIIMSTGGRSPQGSVFPVSKPCRGLVLLRNLHYHVHYVWNPSTGDIAALPDRIPLTMCWHAFTRQPAVSYGLGYCAATQQHKVVRMYYRSDSQGLPASICEVFTLNQSAYWRPVATRPPFCIPDQNWRQGAVLCNGNLHFLHYNGRSSSITAFDVQDETFHVLEPPQDLQLCSDFEITELAGCLCAYVLRKDQWDGDQSRCPLTVWVLRDYHAAAGNWEKIISFIDWGAMPQSDCAMLKSSWIAPLDMYYDGSGQRKVMFATGSCKVFIVDTKTGASEILFSPNDTIIGECGDDWDRPPTVGLFEESLARAGKMGENTIFIDVTTNEGLVGGPLTASLTYSFELESSMPRLAMSLYEFLNTVLWENNGGNFLNDTVLWENNGGNFLNDTVSWENSGDTMFAGRIGLVYEQESSRHVMVRLAYKERNRTTKYYKMVCYLRYVEDMIWKEIDPPSRPIADMPPAHVKNKLYWMADTELGQRSLQHEIVMLDVRTRKFETLQGPPLDHDNSEHVSIIELQNVVCVTYSHQSSGSIMIWAMEDIHLVHQVQHRSQKVLARVLAGDDNTAGHRSHGWKDFAKHREGTGLLRSRKFRLGDDFTSREAHRRNEVRSHFVPRKLGHTM
ncbi:hypothetical protein ACP4OV_011161 [Aristida adscensionis]